MLACQCSRAAAEADGAGGGGSGGDMVRLDAVAVSGGAGPFRAPCLPGELLFVSLEEVSMSRRLKLLLELDRLPPPLLRLIRPDHHRSPPVQHVPSTAAAAGQAGQAPTAAATGGTGAALTLGAAGGTAGSIAPRPPPPTAHVQPRPPPWLWPPQATHPAIARATTRTAAAAARRQARCAMRVPNPLCASADIL
jgi:hypothetical protein